MNRTIIWVVDGTGVSEANVRVGEKEFTLTTWNYGHDAHERWNAQVYEYPLDEETFNENGFKTESKARRACIEHMIGRLA